MNGLSEALKLTLEQEFLLEVAKANITQMPREQLEKNLLQAYYVLMSKENVVKFLMKKSLLGELPSLENCHGKTAKN